MDTILNYVHLVPQMQFPISYIHVLLMLSLSSSSNILYKSTVTIGYRCLYEGCGKHYYSLNSLNSHSRSHQHKEEEVRCQWEGCGKLFDKPCRLKAHMRSHTGDKPYPCLYPVTVHFVLSSQISVCKSVCSDPVQAMSETLVFSMASMRFMHPCYHFTPPYSCLLSLSCSLLKYSDFGHQTKHT